MEYHWLQYGTQVSHHYMLSWVPVTTPLVCFLQIIACRRRVTTYFSILLSEFLPAIVSFCLPCLSVDNVWQVDFRFFEVWTQRRRAEKVIYISFTRKGKEGCCYLLEFLENGSWSDGWKNSSHLWMRKNLDPLHLDRKFCMQTTWWCYTMTQQFNRRDLSLIVSPLFCQVIRVMSR